LSRRHPQGYADALGDRGGGADAYREFDRSRDLPLSRALHAGRADLPMHLAAPGRAGPTLRDPAAAQTWTGEMTPSARYPLTLDGEDRPMVSFRDVSKRYGDLEV